MSQKRVIRSSRLGKNAETTTDEHSLCCGSTASPCQTAERREVLLTPLRGLKTCQRPHGLRCFVTVPTATQDCTALGVHQHSTLPAWLWARRTERKQKKKSDGILPFHRFREAAAVFSRRKHRRLFPVIQCHVDVGYVRNGMCVDPPLCRGTSQGILGSRIIGLVCKGETVGKIGEVDEMGERELVLVVSLRCGEGRDVTRG